jgi:hypothetical protein
METEDLLDDYSTSTLSTDTLSAPPPSPQDASPIDSLFAQHLTSQLQKTLIFATSTSPSSTYTSTLSGAESSNMDVSSSSSLEDQRSSTFIGKRTHLAPVIVPSALPLACTTTYHHQQPTKLTTKHHHGVDPHELDFLLRRVTRNHHRHSHSFDQSRPFRSQTKRIGGFHKKPSRIPLYTKRLAKSNDKDKRMDYGNDGIGSRTSWKQDASRQKSLAISTALEKWKQLQHYKQDDSNTQEEIDRIAHDLKEMGL